MLGLKRKMKLRHTFVSVEESQNAKVTLTKPNEDTLIATIICKCGTKVIEVNFSSGFGGIVLERLHEAKNLHEKGTNVGHVELSETKLLKGTCVVCEREVYALLKFSVDRKWLATFHAPKNDKRIVTYGDCLEITTSIQNGYYEPPRFTDRSLDVILNPNHNCGAVLGLVETRQAIETAIKKVNEFFENDGAESVKPTKTVETVECHHCLTKSKVTTEIKSVIVENGSTAKLLRCYRAWLERTKS